MSHISFKSSIVPSRPDFISEKTTIKTQAEPESSSINILNKHISSVNTELRRYKKNETLIDEKNPKKHAIILKAFIIILLLANTFGLFIYNIVCINNNR